MILASAAILFNYKKYINGIKLERISFELATRIPVFLGK